MIQAFFWVVRSDFVVQRADPLVNSVSSEREREGGRDEKRGQQNDLKWKRAERREEEEFEGLSR